MPTVHRKEDPVLRHPIIVRLVVRRVALGFSQRDLARKIGVHQSVVSDWENGKSAPMFEHLLMWADALGMKFELTVKEGTGYVLAENQKA
jgi:transcriptional regulator with XRE-family HTH domain